MDRILVCTVGGSSAPIERAIRELRPRFVCFLCTDSDAGNPKAASRLEVEGAAGDGTGDTIPARTGLSRDAWEVVIVPHDDPDEAYGIVLGRLVALEHRFPDCEIVADFTGGTKSMTAALVLAKVERPAVSLQVVVGERNDLHKVTHGTERAQRLDTDRIVASRQIALLGRAWSSFGYAEAAAGLDRVVASLSRRARPPQDLLAEAKRLRRLSAAFAAWDRFEYGAAVNGLGSLHGTMPTLGPYVDAVRRLKERDGREPLVLFDLWRNAERRAARGQYDDAVSRCYRLIEWTAQWLLRRYRGLETAKVPAELAPEEISGPAQSSMAGTVKLGLLQAWQLLMRLEPECPAAQAMAHGEAGMKTMYQVMKNHIHARNSSFLAHGFVPIGRERWERIGGWMAERFMPMLREEARGANAPADLPQLPTDPSSLLADDPPAAPGRVA